MKGPSANFSHMKDRLIKVGEAAEILSVTPQTIRNYRKNGKLKGYPTPGGQTLYSEKEIEKYLERQGKPVNKKYRTAFYARSSNGSADCINNQLQQLENKYGQPAFKLRDYTSGLNENRPGLMRLIALAVNGRINRVVITQKDRLTRFGYRYLEELFSSHSVEIEVAFKEDTKDSNEELMQDFMNIVAIVSGRFFHLRGNTEKTKLLQEAQKRIDQNAAETE